MRINQLILYSILIFLYVQLSGYCDEKTIIPHPIAGITKELPAFPGAEGYGAWTRGAFTDDRRPTVYHVTNLSDSGPGSFRNAFSNNGPLLLVFDTGGTIRLTEEVNITTPYVTIAGQTSPGDGICIRGAPIRIKSHDIVIRGLRIRNGHPRMSEDDQGGDCLAIEAEGGYLTPHGQPYNIIIDHCSISWGSDELTETWYACHNITWQYNIIAEPIWSKEFPEITGYGLLVGDRGKNISIHHNLFAHCKARNPECNDDTSGEIINNLIYNWTNKGTDFIGAPQERQDSGFYDFGPSFWNVINNYYKYKNNNDTSKPIQIYNYPGWQKKMYLHDESRFYIEGNESNMTHSKDPLALVNFEGGLALQMLSTIKVSPASGINESSAQAGFQDVLLNAGAHVPRLDAVDKRIIDDVINGTGELIRSIGNADYPELDSGNIPGDTDKDNIPDYYEMKKIQNISGLNAFDKAPSGYYWLEEYINSLIKIP